MSIDRARVVWSEGLFLRPQHFQQQDRHFEGLLNDRLPQLVPFGWGFTTLELDETLLRSGKLGLRSATGVLPDGTPFETPSEATPLKPLDVPAGTANALVHLHAILHRADSKSVALDADTARTRRTRYLARDTTLPDTVAGSESQAEVQLAVLVLGLTLDSALDGAMCSMPVARVIERKANGELSLDGNFIPPMLNALNHRQLRGWMLELEGVVKQRAEMLEARLGQSASKGFADWLLLMLCNRYQPLLAQWCAGSPMHPYLLHQELLKFAGECCTFDAKSRRPRAYPAYQHDALAQVFLPVVETIRLAMVTVPDQTGVQITLLDRGHGLFSADVPDGRMFRTGVFYLAVAAQLDERRLRDEMPRQIRICAPDRLFALTEAQSLGIRIAAEMGAPVAIRYHAHFQYFKLDAASEHWKEIELSRQMAFFVAGDPPGLEMELWFVRTA